MQKIKNMEDGQFIFGALLIIANRLDTLLERDLKEFDITSRQWFLSVIIDNMFSEPPTIKDVAKEMGSSHQNVKQVALKLEQKGLLKMEKDKRDARAIRLKMTDESYVFWEKTRPKGLAFTKAVFEGIEEKELSVARVVLEKILNNLLKMEKKE